MAYTGDAKREYQRKWVAQRRADFFADKFCARCGSVDRLELDHVDPKQKVTHHIWSWSRARRETEIAKCQVLCHDCHMDKTKLGLVGVVGVDASAAKLSEDDIRDIRSLAGILTYREIASKFSMSFSHVGQIIRREKWNHI